MCVCVGGGGVETFPDSYKLREPHNFVRYGMPSYLHGSCDEPQVLKYS
jgi:hypothetical protein